MLQSGRSDAQNAHQHADQSIMNTLIQESQEDDENIPQKPQSDENHDLPGVCSQLTTSCVASSSRLYKSAYWRDESRCPVHGDERAARDRVARAGSTGAGSDRSRNDS